MVVGPQTRIETAGDFLPVSDYLVCMYLSMYLISDAQTVALAFDFQLSLITFRKSMRRRRVLGLRFRVLATIYINY